MVLSSDLFRVLRLRALRSELCLARLLMPFLLAVSRLMNLKTAVHQPSSLDRNQNRDYHIKALKEMALIC